MLNYIENLYKYHFTFKVKEINYTKDEKKYDYCLLPNK